MHPDSLTSRAKSFEHGAAEYDRLRPEFPHDMFTSIRRYAGDRLHGRTLEVGAGTGRATLPLLAAGATIDVVEPSVDMLQVLSQRLVEGQLERVTLRQIPFEGVGMDERFDVVVAAQSFHWADPETRWSRLASVLQPDGVAFMCWNGWHLDPAQHDLTSVTTLYQDCGAELQPDIADERSTTSWAEHEIMAAPGLTLVGKEVFAWPWQLPVSDYLHLLRTTSQYAVAPLTEREALLAKLGTVLGPTVYLSGQTLLLIIATHSPRHD